MKVKEGQLLWTPDEDRIARSACCQFISWLKVTRDMAFEGYDDLWRWSVTETDEFWSAVWDYLGVLSDAPYTAVSEDLVMRPGLRWFDGSRVNFAEHVLRGVSQSNTAIKHFSELREMESISGEELASKVRIMATNLRAMGIKPGDRICALMPNIPETVVAMLSAISIGAVWSNAAPEFGLQSILDRFGQVKPKVLFVTDGYRFGGKDYDRSDLVAEVIAQLPDLETVICLPYLNADNTVSGDMLDYADLLRGEDPGPDAFQFERVPYDHPLWVVFSSGTSGLPKAIVHGHLGSLLGLYLFSHFHMDVKAGDVVFFYTTTGWIMFNFMSALMMCGATAILYDGDPIYPEADLLWQVAESNAATQFGASPTYVEMLRASGIEPGKTYDLSNLETFVMTGAPSQPETMAWAYDHIKNDMWINMPSGGTELAASFVGGTPMLPVYAGEIQARCLGMAVEAWDESGNSVIDRPGELVCTRPFPSMPLYFLNDEDNQRYRETYFETFPGVWHHGDMLKINNRGGCVIPGRSDSTLNRRGIRIGTAEIYRVVEAVDGVRDSIVVCINQGDSRDVMTLFVELKKGLQLDQAIVDVIRQQLKTTYSPRHVPDRVEQIDAVPYTLTGKKMEIPVRKLLNGIPPEKAASRDSMRNPETLDFFITRAQQSA